MFSALTSSSALRLLLLFLSVLSPFAGELHASSSPKMPSSESAYQAALEVLTSGSKTRVPDKRVGPVRVLLTCGDAAQQKLVIEAAAEINDALGYGKLAVSQEDEARIEDDAVVVYIGPKRRGRQLVEDFGVSSPSAFRNSVYYYWWDKERDHHIRSGIIAVDEESPSDVMACDLRYLLLASLGYPGVTIPDPGKAGRTSPGSAPAKLLDEMDAAIIRFCDKHIPPGAKAWEIRNIVEREWPDFSAAFWNPSQKSGAAD